MELPERSTKEELIKSEPTSDALPLQLQSLIKSMRTSAIIMVILSIISVYFIPWAVFYIILANKLKPEELPSSKLVKWAAIATLPLCFGLIPIFIDIEFWRMNTWLNKYKEDGPSAFITDKEFLAGEPKRKKRNTVALVILILIIIIFTIFIIIAVSSSNSKSSTSTSSNSLLTSKKLTPYTSVEHGFKINFPGFPETEHETLQVKGYKIPYTLYSADSSNGDKAYLVGVEDFKGIKINETGTLEGSVNGAVQTKGASLVSSHFSTFQGFKSIDAHYTAPLNGSIYDGYMKGFIKSSKMYIIFTVGENKEGFNRYVNTFRFTR